MKIVLKIEKDSNVKPFEALGFSQSIQTLFFEQFPDLRLREELRFAVDVEE
jgi:hypothetical protein